MASPPPPARGAAWGWGSFPRPPASSGWAGGAVLHGEGHRDPSTRLGRGELQGRELLTVLRKGVAGS